MGQHIDEVDCVLRAIEETQMDDLQRVEDLSRLVVEVASERRDGVVSSRLAEALIDLFSRLDTRKIFLDFSEIFRFGTTTLWERINLLRRLP